jgi:hypothetical protein
MSLASSQPTSPSPRVCSPAALAHLFSQLRSLLTGPARSDRPSSFAGPLSRAPTDDGSSLAAAQRALKTARSVLPRLLFL